MSGAGSAEAEKENLRDALNLLDLLEEGLFRGKLCLLPLAEGINVKRRDDLEVKAAPAHHALHALNALDCLDILDDGSELVLRFDQRGLVGVGRPLAAPLARNGVEGHVGGDVNLCGQGREMSGAPRVCRTLCEQQVRE